MTVSFSALLYFRTILLNPFNPRMDTHTHTQTYIYTYIYVYEKSCIHELTALLLYWLLMN